jgi:hypothetical protein
MKIIAVMEAKMISIVRSLKLKGSKGYDDIHSRILRHCTFKVSKPLSYMCSYSLQSHIYPKKLKVFNSSVYI